jgi:hypothetical protein
MPLPENKKNVPSSTAASAAKTTVVAPIRPPSFLAADNQLLFLSTKSNSVPDSTSIFLGQSKKSTPPVSGVLQSLLMKARADNLRRKFSTKPAHQDLASDSISSTQPAQSIASNSHLPFLQPSGVLVHIDAGEAGIADAVIPHRIDHHTEYLQSDSSKDIRQDVLYRPISSKSDSLRVKSSPKLADLSGAINVESM